MLAGGRWHVITMSCSCYKLACCFFFFRVVAICFCTSCLQFAQVQIAASNQTFLQFLNVGALERFAAVCVTVSQNSLCSSCRTLAAANVPERSQTAAALVTDAFIPSLVVCVTLSKCGMFLNHQLGRKQTRLLSPLTLRCSRSARPASSSGALASCLVWL